MEAYLTQYLNKIAANKAGNTIAAYRNDLQQLLEFLRAQQAFTPGQITPDMLALYVQTLQNAPEGYASATIARKVAACKSFFRDLVLQQVLTTDPTAALPAPRVSKPTPRTLTLAEIQQLIMALAQTNGPKALRDRALLELLFATGMRVTEVVNVRLTAVDWEKGEVQCGESAGPGRRVPLGAASSALKDYLERGRPALARETSPDMLFLNHRGKRLTRQGVWLLLKEAAEMAGLTGEITPHTLRHSFARHLVSQGEDIRRVQTLLGHANLSTTQVYRQLGASPPPAPTNNHD